MISYLFNHLIQLIQNQTENNAIYGQLIFLSIEFENNSIQSSFKFLNHVFRQFNDVIQFIQTPRPQKQRHLVTINLSFNRIWKHLNSKLIQIPEPRIPSMQ